MTTVYFIRHGESMGNINGVCCGWHDIELSEKGVLQAQCTADILKDVRFDKIYSSDLIRACNTALPIAKSHGLEIIKDSGLREIFVGDWENKSWEYINTHDREAYELWKFKPHLMKAPNGESMVEVNDRIVTAVDNIVAQNPDSTICIASHCCVLKNLICYYIGRDLSQLNEIYICNASYSIVEFDEKRQASIVSLNNVSHLENLGYIQNPNWV